MNSLISAMFSIRLFIINTLPILDNINTDFDYSSKYISFMIILLSFFLYFFSSCKQSDSILLYSLMNLISFKKILSLCSNSFSSFWIIHLNVFFRPSLKVDAKSNTPDRGFRNKPITPIKNPWIKPKHIVFLL